MRHRAPIALAVLCALVLGLAVVPPSGASAATPVGVLTAAQLNDAFKQYGDTSGEWSGGDGTASVPLSDGRVAWLFSDTYIGTVNADGSRPANTPLINNSIVVQTGEGLQDTVFGGTAANPVAVMPQTADGKFFWVGDGLSAGGKLRVFYSRYGRSGQGALDVKLEGTSVATFDQTGFVRESVVELPVGDKIAWGVEVVEDGPVTYVYGSEYVDETGLRFAHLARTNADLSAPLEYWNGSAWVSDEASSARILSGVGTTFGVQRADSGWVLVTQQGNGIFHPDMVAYSAPSPTGPFADPVVLYQAPEGADGTGKIVYDAHVHPQSAAGGKLLWSYNVNSLDGGANTADAHIYRPRFVETTWPVPAPDPAAVPGQVTGLTTSQAEDGRVSLSWQPVGGATKYWLYQRNVTDGQTHFARDSVAVTSPSASASLVRDGKTYEFKVTAANDAGEGTASETASLVVHIVPPAAPAGVTAVPSGATGGIRVSWQGVQNAWNYEVYYRDTTEGDGSFKSATMVGADVHEFSVTDLNVDHPHEFYVTARGGGGESARSTVVTATPVGVPPQAPAALTATAKTDGTITLNWTASTTPGVWYWVYQRDVTAEESEFVQLPLPISQGTSMEAGFLADGHVYEFAVTAYDNGGESPRTAVATATSDYPELPPPTGLVATAGNAEVALKWTSLGADIWYWVYQRDVTDGETEFTKLPLPISSGSSMTAGYLTNGHVYEFKVSSLGPGGEGPLSAAVSATPKYPPPAAVTGLTAAAQTDGSIKVSWTDRADTYFWVYQRDVTAGGSFVKLQYPTQGSSFSATQLTNGHVYEFKVQPNAYGLDGPISAAVSAKSTYAPPPAPTGLVARAMGNATIRLDWNGAAGVTFWVYQRDVTAGEATFTKLGLPSLDKTAELGLMKAGHKYEFKIAAQNQGGTSPFSNVASATSYGGLPAAPTNLSAVAQDGKVKLTWSASATAGVQYIVYQRDMTSGDPWDRLPLPITTTSMTAGYLVNGHTYAFRVTAQNGIGESGGTNTVQARPMPPLPTAPATLTATAGNGTAFLDWSASTPSDVFYFVEMRPAGGNWSRMPYPVSGTSLQVYWLRNTVRYEFRVYANNMTGNSAMSPVASARPMPPFPTAPASLVATAGDRTVKLDWSASSVSGVYYWLEYRLSGQQWTRAGWPIVGQTWINYGPLINNKRYEFRIRAANESGVSAPSPVAAVTPIPPVPVAPTISWVTEYNGYFEFYWNDATVEPNLWEIRYKNRLTGEITSGWSLMEKRATYHTPVEEYEILVRSRNSRGWGPWSAPKKAVSKTRWFPNYWFQRPGNYEVNAIALDLVSGRQCKTSSRQIVCFNTDLTNHQQRPMTLGDFLGYPWGEGTWDYQLKCDAQDAAGLAQLRGSAAGIQYGPHLPQHEAVHSEQWARWGWKTFAAMYGAAQLIANKYGGPNKFEVDANLWWGGYVTDPELPDTCVRRR